jgi:hypothetical protein
MRFMKPVAAALALSVTAVTFSAPAEAGRRHRHHSNGGDVAAGAIVGLAAGALIGSALSGPRYAPAPIYAGPPVYYEPAPVYLRPAPVYVQPAPVYYEAWTPEWYSYCSSKYVSFDPRSGTYVAYSGERYLCR